MMKTGPGMWDERFQGGARPYGDQPSRFLVEKVGRLPPGGRILLPGDGGGRNGVWLARQGFQVEILDFSAEGVEAARQWADRNGVSVAAHTADVTTWSWPVREYDAIVSVYLHLPSAARRKVHDLMLQALRPGGFLLIEGFHLDQLAYSSGGPKDPDQLFSEESLRAELSAARHVEVRRELVDLDESDLHRGPGVLVRLLAQV